MRRFCFVAILTVLFWSSCSKESDQPKTQEQPRALKKFSVTIDWVPSPEYYGFFYAKERDIYRNAGFDVDINYASGAPVVAAEIASRVIYAGTTTSDNVLRQYARGAKFSEVVPLLPFNPVVIASLAESPIENLEQLNGKTLGTNKQSSVYQQLLALIDKRKITGKFNEYPIGYGGAVQLKNKEVDAILAYTTNVVVDVEIDGTEVKELRLDDKDLAIYTYGLVLVFGPEERLLKSGLTSEDMAAFSDATLEGYKKGAEDLAGAIASLKKVAPTLDEKKLRRAITKIGKELDAAKEYPSDELDNWVEDPSITPALRKEVTQLYRK